MSDTIRIVIPLTIRKRNGRPRILPPENVDEMACRAQDPHVLRAIGRAWAWRRKIDTGEFNTAQDLAVAEGISDRFVSRMMRLAQQSPQPEATCLPTRNRHPAPTFLLPTATSGLLPRNGVTIRPVGYAGT